MLLSSARHHVLACTLLALGVTSLVACGADADGDAPCPDGTWRSGSGCIDDGIDGDPGDTGASADVGASDTGTADSGTLDSGSDDAGSEVGDDVEMTDTGASDASIDASEADAGPTTPTTLPFAVDDYYAPSGFMGDGAIPGGITVADDACAGERAGEGSGVCRSFTWTRGSNGWGGVFWQYPDGNWGDAPGLAIPEGATEVTFYAWGATGDEVINFLVGIGDADGFAAESGGIALSTAPTRYSVSLDDMAVGAEVVGAFGWVTDTGDGATFTVDDIQWR